MAATCTIAQPQPQLESRESGTVTEEVMQTGACGLLVTCPYLRRITFVFTYMHSTISSLHILMSQAKELKQPGHREMHLLDELLTALTGLSTLLGLGT